MEFIVKKTTELTSIEKEQILSLFNEVFEKSRTIQEFNNQYLNNPLGYSFHSLMLKDGSVVGHNSGIPCYYKVNGERQLFICNVDTMIKKQCRGIDNFFDMMIHATNRYKEEDATMLYGFPNDNSYPILKSLGLMEDIGKLDTYCLPYRIGGIKKSLSFLNLFSMLFCRFWVTFSSYFASKQVKGFSVEKEAESYNTTRYKRNDGHYSIVKMDSFQFMYKIITYEGVRTAFLVDVVNKSARNFCKAVKYIIQNENVNFDLILYVGHLPFSSYGMIKFPRRFEPKHFNFTGFLLNEKNKDLLFNIESWYVNFSNYYLI